MNLIFGRSVLWSRSQCLCSVQTSRLLTAALSQVQQSWPGPAPLWSSRAYCPPRAWTAPTHWLWCKHLTGEDAKQKREVCRLTRPLTNKLLNDKSQTGLTSYCTSCSRSCTMCPMECVGMWRGVGRGVGGWRSNNILTGSQFKGGIQWKRHWRFTLYKKSVLILKF